MGSGYIFKVEPSRLPYGQVVGSEGRKQVKTTLRVSSLATERMDDVATTKIGKAVGGKGLGGEQEFHSRCAEFDISSRYPSRYVSRQFTTQLSLYFRRWG